MTARAQTESEAATLALGHIGQPSIADLAEDNIRARAASQFFGGARDALLREKWWSFAKGWALPAADVAESVGPLKLRFMMPPDCLRIRYLTDGDDAVHDEESGAWDIEASTVTFGDVPIEAVVLVTNITAPRVAYTRRIETVRLWDAIFLDGFCFELASRMARKLGRSQSTGERLHERAMRAIESASAIDSKEASRKTITRTPSLIAARFGSRTPY